jgi:hypothetical protein
MTYARKTRDVWHVEIDYGRGWEHELTESSHADARAQARCYRENVPEYPLRIRRRRERIE